MVTSRHIEEADIAVLVASLAQDVFHPGVKTEVFYEPGTLTNVYEDEAGPIMFVRGCRSLRIDMCFVNNGDNERNKAAMLAGFEKLAAGAKAAGFKDIVTSSNSPVLVAFGEKYFGFVRMQAQENGEVALRREL